MHGRALTSLSRLFRRCALLALALAALQPEAATSQDKAPHLLLEPTEYTDVLDAFDSQEDPFDFNVRLHIARSQENAVIERERNAAGGFAVDALPVAEYRSVRTQLVLGAEVGVYKDVMVYARLPLVFSDTRELSLPEAASCESSACRQRRRTVAQLLDDAVPNASDPTMTESNPLFTVDPATAARTRSGVPAVDAGVAWGIMNQYRTPGLPTWVAAVETRFSVGSPMRACLEGDPRCDPGTSRGTTRLLLATRWSYRYRFVEPFLGFDHAFEWAAGAAAAFEPGGDGADRVDPGLPSVTGLTAGGAIVPWEHRGRFQQFAVDVRGRAEYVSAGRDYTPLFDWLGASANPYLDRPVQREGRTPVAFNGLTQVSAHARLGLDLALAMQAARYVRFRVGVTLSHATRHLLTGAAACTGGGRGSTAASACGESAPNALHRAVIDTPGQRFLQASHLAYSVFASAAAQF